MRDTTVHLIYEDGSRKSMAVCDMSDAELIDCQESDRWEPIASHPDLPDFLERVRLEQFIRALGLSSKRVV